MELVVGPRTKTTPFTERAVAAGMTKAMVYNHTVLPIGTDDPAAEYRALTEAAAIWDVGCERQVQIAGPDAHRLITYLCARDLRDLPVGVARYAPMCDHDGRLINDPMALRLEEATFWLSIADSDVLLWTRAVAGEGAFDVEVTEPDVWPLAIQGPLGEDVVAAALGDWVRGIGFFRFVRHVHDGIPLVVCRSGWSGQGGFELFLTDGTKGEQLWDLLWEAGEPFGLRVGAPTQPERIESFLLSFGGDTDPETDPDEAGIGRFVSLGDCDGDVPGHDFIGKEALLARRASGTQRRLVGLVVDGEPPAPLRSPQTVRSRDGSPVGTLRALTRSPRFGANLGLALLSPPWFEPGIELRVNLDDADRTATTTSLPFDLSRST
ncbi:glycine cleavage T C-terminal barrel domain-containing protein [Candidatus Poriferisodalis sp.]|uniref:glycine cleavage T C-terminal barrel domain-containing protein n=1 Tax=Candidatus Poriferisodalis sp. TaxID=3101277 RepID=UPI003B010C85